MTGRDAAAMLALLSTAFWNGRPIPAESAKLYAEHLRPLDVRDVHAAIEMIIDTNTSGFYPAIGSIVDVAHDFETARLEQERSQREHPEPRSLQARTGWLVGAPWFVQLQIARQRRDLKAGFPLKELHAGGKTELLDECSGFSVAVTEQELSRWALR